MNDAVMKYRAILDSLCELSFCPIKIKYKSKTLQRIRLTL